MKCLKSLPKEKCCGGVRSTPVGGVRGRGKAPKGDEDDGRWLPNCPKRRTLRRAQPANVGAVRGPVDRPPKGHADDETVWTGRGISARDRR